MRLIKLNRSKKVKYLEEVRPTPKTELRAFETLKMSGLEVQIDIIISHVNKTQ